MHLFLLRAVVVAVLLVISNSQHSLIYKEYKYNLSHHFFNKELNNAPNTLEFGPIDQGLLDEAYDFYQLHMPFLRDAYRKQRNGLWAEMLSGRQLHKTHDPNIPVSESTCGKTHKQLCDVEKGECTVKGSTSFSYGIHRDSCYAFSVVCPFKNWGDLCWSQSANVKSLKWGESMFERMNVARHFKGYINHAHKLRLYKLEFTTRRKGPKQPMWHTDWTNTSGTAFVVLIPLWDTNLQKDKNMTHLGQILYKDLQGTVFRYEYRRGFGLAFGDNFMHSSEPGDLSELYPEGVVFLTFCFGTDKQEYWESILPNVQRQGYVLQRPDGKIESTFDSFNALPTSSDMSYGDGDNTVLNANANNPHGLQEVGFLAAFFCFAFGLFCTLMFCTVATIQKYKKTNKQIYKYTIIL